MVWRVALTKQAERDLEEAVAFLAAKSPAAAERLGLGLVDTIFELENLPRKGAPLVARPGYRRVLHRPWHLIFYRVDESAGRVEIIRIWDGRRNPRNLIF
ncbi:MAG: type II toxin-antitoxin system RelE/ParE family toxin [Opitutaceae bacterium]|jgi:plasmid stabilization system protein ParE